MSDEEIQQCDTAEEEKVPPDLEPSPPETPIRNDIQPNTEPPSPPFPHKSPHFLPLQNGPVQQPEPSAAVAAVTVTASVVNPATVPSSSHLGLTSSTTPLPSSTSPADGVPFPSSLLRQEEFSVSSTIASSSSKTLSPVLEPKNYDSGIVKPHKSTNSDVVHSLPYPICSSYSDYTVNYSTNQYSNKHSYHNQDTRDVNQRFHSQKLTTNSYYHQSPHQQPPLSKYSSSKDGVSRSTSKALAIDGYRNESYVGNTHDNKSSSSELNYCVGQVCTTEKTCDSQYVYKKTPPNNVYNYKTNELLNSQNSSESAAKSTTDKSKIANEYYSAINKTKVPNRTTYYQSIVNKTHSRHKSSRRVLPASAYESSKQVISNYSSTKPEVINTQGCKPVQYSTQHYSTETKRSDYYPPIVTSVTHTSNTYNYNNHKSDSSQARINNNSNHSSWSDQSYAHSRSYKVHSDQYSSGYRDKQSANTLYNSNTANSKTYYYPTSKSYTDTRGRPTSDTSVYTNSDYYHKGNVTYSRTGNTHSSANDSYKTSNYVLDNSSYSSKSSSYQYSKPINDKNRNYYPNQENSYKAYPPETVPKQNVDDSHGYKIHSEVNSYSNYSNSNSLKSKEIVAKTTEVLKPITQEQVSAIEQNPSSHPVAGETNSYYPLSKEKSAYYTHIDSTHSVHRRTPPPVSKPQSSFDSLKPSSKDPESFRISSSAAIISYSQIPHDSSPLTVYDNPRSVVKTLWSPTETTATVTTSAPSRELITASSRDSHSSHSNSSISSLSQLSQSLGSGAAGTSQQPSKEYTRESRSSSNGHSRCSSRDDVPICTTSIITSTSPVTTTTTATTTSGAYGISGSLTSLIFSKPSWTSPSVSTVLTNPSSHFTPPASGRVTSPVPSVLPLAPSLPSGHHSSPFSHHASPVAPLHPAAPHVMFAAPLPTAGPLSSPSLPLATASAAASFGADPLLAPPSTDLLRRELDTRFLASQDRSINVGPPPYLRTEMHQHQHQHTHMHQHSPFLPPPIGGSLLPPTAAHLYDKFPKVDSSFYGRNALGLPGYPSLSPLLAPGSATATPTPFAPPGHLAAFQPKISPLVKAKTVKSGRWCAMHVRISWEIYHHQQKQQAESQKSGTGSSKTVPDLLRPPNHLFGSLPRPHELSFSSPLLSSSSSLHGRSPYDVPPQHPGFLGPSPAHLGITPFARPSYPGLGMPGNSFGGLGSLASLTSAGMLAGRELPPGYLSIGQDPWSRLHRTPPNFPSPSAMNPSSWGGLKAEAERERLQRREDQEREKEKEKLKKAEAEKREEREKSKEKEKREHEKQKERDRENRISHVPHTSESVRNGESSEKGRDREWERNRERRDSSRSPVRSAHKNEISYEVNTSGHKQDVKVKEEKKEEERNKESPSGSSGSDRERTKSNEPVTQESSTEFIPRSMLSGLPIALSSAEQARMSSTLGAISQQVPPPQFWNPLPPPPPQTSAAAAERYRALELQHARELDREQLMQKYATLSSVMPLLPERYREAELARHLSSSEAAAREVERQLQADRDRQAYERTKLPPPPLRPNDPPYVPAHGLPPTGGLFSSISNPFLNSLCSTNYPPRTKPGSPGGIGNGIPPPLIPCVSQGGSPVTSSTTPSPLHLKLSAPSNSGVESSREHYASKDRRDLPSHSTEIESQSR